MWPTSTVAFVIQLVSEQGCQAPKPVLYPLSTEPASSKEAETKATLTYRVKTKGCRWFSIISSSHLCEQSKCQKKRTSPPSFPSVPFPTSLILAHHPTSLHWRRWEAGPALWGLGQAGGRCVGRLGHKTGTGVMVVIIFQRLLWGKLNFYCVSVLSCWWQSIPTFTMHPKGSPIKMVSCKEYDNIKQNDL